MLNCDLVISHDFIKDADLAGKTVIVIDTLRATSVMTTALANGARSVKCVTDPAQALAIKVDHPDYRLGGERDSLKINGFDFSNSPLEYTQAAVFDRNLVMTTSNGTKTLLKAIAGVTVLIGCLLNATAVMDHAISLGRDIVLINAGTAGRFSLDDYITAGAMLGIAKAQLQMSDAARGALLLYEAHPDIHSALVDCLHYNRLKELGLEEDLNYCLTMDRYDIVPESHNGLVTLIKSPTGESR